MNLPIRFFLVLTMRSAVDKKKLCSRQKKKKAAATTANVCVCFVLPRVNFDLD